MKSKIFFSLIIVGIMSLLFGYYFFSKENKETILLASASINPIIYEENIEISLGESLPNFKDYGEEFTQDIFWLDKNIEEKIKKTGVYRGVISFGYQPMFVTLSVVDTNPPVIQDVKDITIYEGDSIDLEKKVSVIDDSNEEVSLIVKGEYSLSKEGVYPLTYEATDASGNVSTEDFKLIVMKKEEIKPVVNATSTKTSKGYDIVLKNGAYYINGILVANKTYSLSSSYAPGDITKETSEAFTKMQAAAAKEGISLKIISGYRSYTKQQSTYNRYVKRDGKTEADRYSARPGHSEHQTGLAFDVNSLEQSFGNTKAGIWLSKNCYKYGFILRYPKGKEAITGYMYEPWHFRYLGSEAVNLYNNGNWITLEEYLGIDSKYAY